MSMFDQITTAAPERGGGRCGVLLTMDKLPDAEKGPFGAALAMSPADVTSTSIARVLRAEGYTIAASAIQRHRRGECACAVRA